MRRYILTGAPGAGKTALVRWLEARGEAVVEEAATDVIALEQARGIDAPWEQAGFIEAIVALQQQRLARADAWMAERVFFDRSPLCALALARFLESAPPPTLAAALERMEAERTYRRCVLFIGHLGFVAPTPARRIGFEDALRFEAVHRRVYEEAGYELVEIAAGPIDVRGAAILNATDCDAPPPA